MPPHFKSFLLRQEKRKRAFRTEWIGTLEKSSALIQETLLFEFTQLIYVQVRKTLAIRRLDLRKKDTLLHLVIG